MPDFAALAEIASRGYAHPEVLVSTEWLAAHLDDSAIRIVESNEDSALYPARHIPGAVQVDWTGDLHHPTCRDYLDRPAFEALLSRLGITRETTIVFYGDKHNWWACFAFWIFQLFGHGNAKILDGGRLKWEKEGRPFTRDLPDHTPTRYVAAERDDRRIRIFRDEVLRHSAAGRPLIDVRGPEEFSGEMTQMPEYPQEGVLFGGHIPGAKNVPWARAANPGDSTFRTAAELRAVYEGDAGLRPDQDVVTYCRIGERSSHTWFVLRYLLGYPTVRNYDGSWTEWGNSVGLPIER